MTKQIKFRWLLSAGAIATALLALSALAKPLDDRYVKQAGYATDRLVDSLKHDREIDDIHARLARIDTNVVCLRPKNARLPECK